MIHPCTSARGQSLPVDGAARHREMPTKLTDGAPLRNTLSTPGRAPRPQTGGCSSLTGLATPAEHVYGSDWASPLGMACGSGVTARRDEHNFDSRPRRRHLPAGLVRGPVPSGVAAERDPHNFDNMGAASGVAGLRSQRTTRLTASALSISQMEVMPIAGVGRRQVDIPCQAISGAEIAGASAPPKTNTRRSVNREMSLLASAVAGAAADNKTGAVTPAGGEV